MSQAMATAQSASTLSRLATRCHSLHHRHFKAFETWKGKSILQLLLPGCNASNQHGCHPACLQAWLARLKTAVTSFSLFCDSLLTLLCSGTAPALCVGRPLQLRRKRRMRRVMMEETRVMMAPMRRTSISPI